MALAIRQTLPGVRFQAEPPPTEVLPRMDIAAFVGFASAGPLHTPVAVEDVVRFRNIFGPDLPLAWDATSGGMLYAHLGPAVEAFFRNGGRRCWVVRVAGAAAANEFRVPGLVDANNGAEARIWARCAGSWSDGLRVGTRLQSEVRGAVFFEHTDNDYVVKTSPLPEPPQPGDLLQLIFGDVALLLLEVQVVSPDQQQPALLRAQGQRGFWFAPTGAGVTPLAETEGLALAEGWQSAGLSRRQPAAARLAFELLIWRGDEAGERLGNLAFSVLHPRFWGNLPDDEALFKLPGVKPIDPPGALYAEASTPRFPLAGPKLAGAEAANTPALFLPLDMALQPDPALARGPGAAMGTALERDGLAAFSAGLFFDTELASLQVGSLLEAANQKYYLREQQLKGFHSLLPIDEVTLLVVPDAAQPGWELAGPPDLGLLPAPQLDPPGVPDADGAFGLAWSLVTGATGYQLQEADEPDFTQPLARYDGPEHSAEIPGRTDCPRRRFYRVRATRGGQIGPWSNTVQIVTPAADFLACDTLVLEAPALELGWSGSPVESYQLSWPQQLEVTDYLIEESGAPDFTSVTSRIIVPSPGEPAVIVDPDELFHGGRRGDGVFFYRVRARHNTAPGPWSLTEIIAVASRQSWAAYSPAAYDAGGRAGQLLAVQQALLRFCAARADILALLHLPAHYREDAALEHVASLVADNLAAEDRSLSYGALYHPWLAVRVTGAGVTGVRLTPPDGPVCGALAAAAITRGAWRAPANDPLSGVVALDPPISRRGWERLFAGQINLVRADPRGFMALSADTLSRDPDLRPINVRRLLILLRRLALREGNVYVFQPNNRAFHRLVQRRFEQLLGELYGRGALAGATAGDAFQVVVDGSVNTPASLDQGRCIIELRVAPARPLVFLTVRLVQSGDEALVIREF